MRTLFLICLLGPMLMLGQNNSQILSLTEVQVKMGHEAQFMEGMKMYNKCYADNNGENDWKAWRRVQGTNMSVAFTYYMDNWAELDDEGDAAGNSCRAMFNDFIMPHVESYQNSYASTMPDYSPTEARNTDKVWVTYFRVNNSKDFLDAINTVSSALQEVEGNKRGYWFAAEGGGADSYDYMVAWPFEKYADLDTDMDSVWEVCAKKHGDKKTNEVRSKFRNAMDDSWSFIYDASEDLSYVPTTESN